MGIFMTIEFDWNFYNWISVNMKQIKGIQFLIIGWEFYDNYNL